MLVLITSLLIFFAYKLGRYRALQFANAGVGLSGLKALPFYYGALTGLWCALPCLLLICFWFVFDQSLIEHILIQDLDTRFQEMSVQEQGLLLNSISNVAANAHLEAGAPEFVVEAARQLNQLESLSNRALLVCLLILGGLFMAVTWQRLTPETRARVQVEKAVRWLLFSCAIIAIFTTIGILVSVVVESMRFFQSVSVLEFLFGLDWNPQIAIRDDQVGSSGAFGAIPLFTGTLLVCVIAMLIAVPMGLMSAIYLSEYAAPGVREIVKPLLEVLAGIPTVVYGFFAALTIAPFIRETGGLLGLDVSSESALAAGLVMGVMIIPFVSSISDDVINAVPQSLRDGALGLGATRSEAIKQVVLPAALPGILGGVLLAVSRAIGETMIVVMAAGLTANLTANPLQSVTTVTVQIVTLLVGDQEFNSPKTLAAFALGLVLFCVTLTLNYIALRVVRNYRAQYQS